MKPTISLIETRMTSLDRVEGSLNFVCVAMKPPTVEIRIWIRGTGDISCSPVGDFFLKIRSLQVPTGAVEEITCHISFANSRKRVGFLNIVFETVIDHVRCLVISELRLICNNYGDTKTMQKSNSQISSAKSNSIIQTMLT